MYLLCTLFKEALRTVLTKRAHQERRTCGFQETTGLPSERTKESSQGGGE